MTNVNSSVKPPILRWGEHVWVADGTPIDASSPDGLA
jgi:hypothetical protein